MNAAEILLKVFLPEKAINELIRLLKGHGEWCFCRKVFLFLTGTFIYTCPFLRFWEDPYKQRKLVEGRKFSRQPVLYYYWNSDTEVSSSADSLSSTTTGAQTQRLVVQQQSVFKFHWNLRGKLSSLSVNYSHLIFEDSNWIKGCPFESSQTIPMWGY